jgi:beta-D-xylosidase 4
MTNMALRPGTNNPGRTYKWYNGTAIYEFGYGMHYTNFSANITFGLQQSYAISDLVSSCQNSSETYLYRCPFTSVGIDVKNTGSTSSDCVTLSFLAGNFSPTPQPKKLLVSYQRLFSIASSSAATATLNLTLGSLARVDEQGNKVLYPGNYSLLIDNQPLASYNFTLTGSQTGAVLEHWPQPPAHRRAKGIEGYEDYFVGGYGSDQEPVNS